MRHPVFKYQRFYILGWLLTHFEVTKSDLRVTRNKIPPFEPHLVSFSKTVFYEVNLNAQSSHSATKTHDTFDALDCILFEIIV